MIRSRISASPCTSRCWDRRRCAFLLADDAGRRQNHHDRTLRPRDVVPPTHPPHTHRSARRSRGQLGTGDAKNCFRLSFRIVRGEDARTGNPFSGPESDRVIVSVDTLVTERVFNRLKSPRKPSPTTSSSLTRRTSCPQSRQPDYRVRKTNRYRLAEAIAGAEVDGERWELPWSTRHLLLLTATPHMGNDSPYYFLWRLFAAGGALHPWTLSTGFPANLASATSSAARRRRCSILTGNPCTRSENCDTLSYNLSDGAGSEQETLRRDDGIHSRLLQPRGSLEPISRPSGDGASSSDASPVRLMPSCDHSSGA